MDKCSQKHPNSCCSYKEGSSTREGESVNMTEQEEDIICRMHKLVGDRWELIAGRIPGKTAEDIEIFWLMKNKGAPMASGMEGEKAVVEWEVGPTKDVVQALIETLVRPRLPFEVSTDDPPSEDSQKSVARQMHAVVLLYNYYHRKQKLELEFLDFVSFCKLAVSLRPSLIPFMKMIDGNELVKTNGAEDQLSVTEKAIKNACDIAMSLDASKDAPVVEGCPISKVAVLLIDSNKENCLLQFGVATEGVWSLIEKDVNESSICREILAEERVRKKRKTNNHQIPTDDNKVLQLGYDAVKEVVGMDSYALAVLETHVVYSLSKEKSATQFYMMQCRQPFSINQSVPLKFLVECLHGPLADKFCDSWSTTPLVAHFHMLPYVGFISDWLPRKDLCSPIFNSCGAPRTKNYDEKELPRSKISSLPFSEYSGEYLDHIDTSTSSSKVANENSEEKSKHSSGDKTARLLEVFLSGKNVTKECIKRSGGINSAKKGGSKKIDNNEKNERGSLSAPSRGLIQNMVRDDDATQRMNTRSSLKSDERKKVNSIKNISPAQHDTQSPEDGVNNLKLLKSNGSHVEKPCDQTRPAADKALDKFEPPALASEDLQNALALLDRKRKELYSKICNMEDELALYEHTIERIRDGGEVELAHACVVSILNGSDHFLLKNDGQVQDDDHQPGEEHTESKTKTKISCSFLPGKSSCQDLEYASLKNNWRLPRYFVRPSDGQFVSNVVVQSKDFNLSSKGGTESSPCEARESAAAQMITKIREACASS